MTKLLDRYTGEMVQPTMRIVSVQRNPLARYNPIHEELEGALCAVSHLECGSEAVILYEPPYDPGIAHHLYTTSVRKISKGENTICFETRNTKYMLCALEEF